MDNRANYQVDIGGNVFIAIQNMFAEFTKIVQVVEKVDESVQNSTRQITEHVDKSANAFGGLQKQIERISLTSIIEQVKQLAEGVANLTGPGIGFEQSMADLSSITGIAGDELRDLGKVARQTGKESGLGAQQAANAFALLASQIQVDKIGMEGLKALQQNTITLSHAAGMSMNDAATALAGTINQFGLQATEANRVINILAAGSKYGAAEIVDLSQSFKVVGAQFLIKNSDAVAEMTAQVTATNVAQEQAAIRTDTVQQMMARCQARIDDLKIGFFELTGSTGGYATIIAQQAVTVSQLLPLFGLFGKAIGFVTSAEKLHTVWAGAVKAATVAWTGVQWLLNASLWGCPVTWIVAGITALIAVITVCVTKVEGWGKQWDSVVKFMKLTGKLFVETIKYEFSTMVNGIMIGLDYIKLGWYKFKKAVGLGDKAENEAMISQISGDIDSRKKAIVDGAKNLKNLAQDAGSSLSWELSWKNGKNGAANAVSPLIAASETPDGTKTPRTKQKVNIDFSKTGTGTGSGSKTVLDLNKIIPDMKGSAAYTAIASRLSAVRVPSLATAAASLAMPLTVAATTLPQSGGTARPTPTELAYNSQRRGGVTMSKFCDTIEIHIANADGKGYNQIEEEVTAVLKKVLDEYEA